MLSNPMFWLVRPVERRIRAHVLRALVPIGEGLGVSMIGPENATIVCGESEPVPSVRQESPEMARSYHLGRWEQNGSLDLCPACKRRPF
jgi:hypothetical protein